MRAAHLVEDIAIVAKREQRRAALRHGIEQPIAERILARQLGKIIVGAHRRRGGLQQFFLARFGRVGEIAPAAVVLVADAAIGLGERRERELLRIVGFEQLPQVLIGLRRGNRDIIARARRCGAGGQRQHRYRNSHLSETHRSIPLGVFLQGHGAKPKRLPVLPKSAQQIRRCRRTRAKKAGGPRGDRPFSRGTRRNGVGALRVAGRVLRQFGCFRLYANDSRIPPATYGARSAPARHRAPLCP